MVTITQSKAQNSHLSALQIHKQKHQRASIVLATIAGAASVVVHAAKFMHKESIHTSALTGQKWVQELLEGTHFLIYFI